MLRHFFIVSYDGETMGYDSLVKTEIEIAKEIFDYVLMFYKSSDKTAEITITEYKLPKKYRFETEDDFFNSTKWNDGTFEDGVIVCSHTQKFEK